MTFPSTLSSTDAADRSIESIHQERPVRSLSKAISWRITGSLDTIMLSWLFTQQLSVAIAIGGTEVITKVVLYYFHERLWNRIPLGLN